MLKCAVEFVRLEAHHFSLFRNTAVDMGIRDSAYLGVVTRYMSHWLSVVPLRWVR